MKNHTRIYLEHFGFIKKGDKPLSPDDIEMPCCEVCGAPAQDIHHIDARGRGGSKTKDTIENLRAVCRTCHISYGDKAQFMEELKNIHKKLLNRIKSVA